MQVFQRKDSTWGQNSVQGSESLSLAKDVVMMSTHFSKHVQDHHNNSSSTQSTGESGGGEVASFKEHSRYGNTTLPMVAQTSWPLHCNETAHFNGFLTPEHASQPTVMSHLEMMGLVSSRVPLPHNIQENEPIFVNAKQYHAILRRRKHRAKLEAQNKLIKSRKPYLHESRHLHALKRARGSGGRFLNTKKLQESSNSLCSSQMANGHDRSESSPGSNMFQNPQFRFSGYPSTTQHVSSLMSGT